MQAIMFVLLLGKESFCINYFVNNCRNTKMEGYIRAYLLIPSSVSKGNTSIEGRLLYC